MSKSEHFLRSVPTLIQAVLIPASLGMTPLPAQTPPPKAATHDAVDEQSLQQKAAASVKLDAVLSAKSKPVGGDRPAVQSSLLAGSIVLSDGANFTLVPVGSILNLPSAQRHRVLEKPEGNFLFWPAFLKRNTGWLAAREVPLQMAKGDPKAAQSVLRETSADHRVVVAVLRGGPITILEPEPSAEKPSGSR